MTIDPVAKVLFGLGIAFLVIGVAWQFGWIQHLKLGRLPGDIAVEKENMKFYMPITTGILLSVILSVIMWLFRK